MLAMLSVAICGCGQELEERTVRSPSNALVDNWQSTGDLLGSGFSGTRFGQSVSTSNNWVAVTRQGTSPSDVGETDLFQNTGSGWIRTVFWPTSWDRHPVAVLSPNWLVIGEPCLSPGTTCQGRAQIFLWNGSIWVHLGQSITTSTAWDYGRAMAIRDLSGSGATVTSRLAIGGGGAVEVYSLQPSFLLNTQTLLEPATPYQDTGFGTAVAITADGVAVAAPTGWRSFTTVRGTGYSPGYVYDFNLAAFTSTRLTGVGTEGADAPGFGASLAASSDGKSIAVGAASEVGRSLTAYVLRLGTTGAWTVSNTILAPKGAVGTDIGVAIDGDLAVLTNEPGSINNRGEIRIYQLGLPPLGPTLDITLSINQAGLDINQARAVPMEMRNSRLVFGQPSFSANEGSVSTYAVFAPVRSAPPP